MCEDLQLVRRFKEFGCQVLTCEMQLLMQTGTPFGAMAHIVDDASESDPHAGAALAGIPFQF